MSKKDRKNCKHDKIRAEADYYSSFPVCATCGETLEWDDIVIRTKAYDKAREDVIVKLRKFKEYAGSFEPFKTWDETNSAS